MSTKENKPKTYSRDMLAGMIMLHRKDTKLFANMFESVGNNALCRDVLNIVTGVCTIEDVKKSYPENHPQTKVFNRVSDSVAGKSVRMV